jgi:hypothetical protein
MFSFFGNDPGGYGTMEMRRRIALQMMMGGGKKGYPKTLGEGLASIGDSLGEIGMMRALLAAQAKQDASSKATAEKIYGPGSTTAPTTESAPVTTPPVQTSSVDPAATESAPVETPPVDTAAIPAAPSVGPDTAHFTPQNEPLIAAPPTEAAEIGSDAGSRLPATFAERFDAVNPQPPKQAAVVPLVTAKEQPAAVLAPKPMIGELEGGVETGPDNAPAFAKTSRIPVTPDVASTTSPRADASVSQKVVDSEPGAGSAPIDDRLMHAVKMIESGGKPHAHTGSYKGLYQLSDSEFSRYGGQGDIYDPAENTRVAKLKLADERDELSRKLGRPVTPEEVYLAHQQGVGGATAHLTHPDQPAWQSMASTGEGRQKGERWARQAIWINVPDDMKSRFGSVDNITSQQFADLWREKYNRYAGDGTQTASASPRDSVAAKMVANNVQPPQPDAQDAVLSDVLAAREAKDAVYPQTASLGREGDVQSDAPPVGGMVGPATGNAIAATAAARRNGIASKLMQQPPVAPAPQGAATGLDPTQTDPRLAEANLLSPVATDVPKSVPTQHFRTANDAITSAPPGPPQVITPQAAPTQAPPQPEQLPPELRQGPPPPIPAPEPMSPREVGARRALAGEGSQDPVVRGAADLVIKEETDRRNRIDGMRGAQYQEDRKHYDEIAKEALKWQLGAEERNQKRAENPLKLEELRQKINEGTVKVLDGRLIERGKDGVWKDVTPPTPGTTEGGPPSPKMTAEQSKALKFHGWTSLAEEQLRGKDKLLAEGLQQELLGKVPFVGNRLQQAEYRRVRGAAERFVQGFLRDVSGAVIGPEEMVKHQKSFLPAYGDDEGTIHDKKIARDQIIGGLYAEAGPGRAIADWQKQDRDKKALAEHARLDKEMDTPNTPKIVGKIYKDTETGKRRAWTGDHWEEF